MSGTKDAVATMGGILPDEAGGRDAVHVAVFSAVSDETIYPGQHVGISDHGGGNPDVEVRPTRADSVGIADPFLMSRIVPGDRFWVYLYPRTITALSHKWSHPAFDGAAAETSYAPPSKKLESERWLIEYCACHSGAPSYESLIEMANANADGKEFSAFDGIYWHFGTDAQGEIPPEIWSHLENVIGKPLKGKKPTYYSCSC